MKLPPNLIAMALLPDGWTDGTVAKFLAQCPAHALIQDVLLKDYGAVVVLGQFAQRGLERDLDYKEVVSFEGRRWVLVGDDAEGRPAGGILDADSDGDHGPIMLALRRRLASQRQARAEVVS